MIVIDKLCYQSGLRYVNATEKFVYAMFSLLLCVLSRSVWAPLLVFTANGILTVKKGGIPLFRYIKLLLIPAGHSGDSCKYIENTAGCIRVSGGNVVHHRQPRFGAVGRIALRQGIGSGDLSLFPVAEHNDDGYSGGACETASAAACHRADDVGLPFHIRAA